MKVIEMVIDKPLLNGKLFIKSIDNWSVSWETNENYRHWCFQKYSGNDETALFILFNPGSLNNNPDKLSSDPTLRILREVCYESGINPFVINLFDYCTSDYNELTNHWKERDYKSLVYEKLLQYKFIFSLFAYGSIDNDDPKFEDIVSRIKFVESIFKEIPRLDFDDSYTTHPLRWQIDKKKIKIRNTLIHAKSVLIK